MFDQPRYESLQASSLFPDGRSARMPEPGTLTHQSRAEIEADSGTSVPEVTWEVLQRGRQSFDVFCSPCHGRTGEGNGMAVQKGFPAPPSLFSERVHRLEDKELETVIDEGYGRMFGYGYRIPLPQRWEIIAYIRALQLGHAVAIQDIPEYERERLTRRGREEGP